MEEIPKPKAKYLKRAERAAKRNAELSARRRNQRDAQRVQQAAIAAQAVVKREPGHYKFSYTENDLKRIQANKKRMTLPLRAQAALAAAALTADPAPSPEPVVEGLAETAPEAAPVIEMASENQT